MWYLYLGPSVKSFNVDVNVLHMFLLMTVIVLCISGPFMKIFTTITDEKRINLFNQTAKKFSIDVET